MKKLIVIIIIFTINTIFLFAKQNINIEKGELDFSKYKNKKYITLNGDWEVFKEKFILEEDFEKYKNEIIYHKMPGNWISLFGKTQVGYATFKMKIKNIENDKLYAIKIPDIRNAYTLYINGEKKIEIGKIGINKKDTIPDINPEVVVFKTNNNEAELIFHISNFHGFWGGAWSDIYFGEYRYIEKINLKKNSFELFFVGALIMIAIYQISLYLRRRKNIESLYFSSYCILMVFRILLTGEIFVKEIFDISWVWIIRFEYITYYFGVPLFTTYIVSAYAYKQHKKIITILQLAGVLFSLIILMSSSFENVFYIYLRDSNHILTILNMGLSIKVLISGAKTGEKGALATLIGGVFFAFIIINDMSIGMGAESQYLLQYGLFLFLALQSWLLADRFSNTFNKIEDLSNKVEKNNVELKRMDKLKDEFLFGTSYELINPINGIIGISDSIIKDKKMQFKENFNEKLEIISYSALKIKKMVYDILDFEKIKNKDIKLDYQKNDICNVVENILSFIKYSNPSSTIEYINNCKKNITIVYGDRQRLEQIFYNLILNSLKFLSEGKFIIKNEKIGNQINVELIISGKIKNEIYKFMENFEKNIENEELGNIDISLGITKKLIEMHDGNINIENKNNEMKISINFPYNDCEGEICEIYEKKQEIYDEIPEILYDNTKKNIFVVDDEIINLKIINQYLKELDYNVILVNNPNDFFKYISKYGEPEIAVIDIIMPEITGYELCKNIRKQYDIYKIPVLFMASQSRLEEIESIFQAGGNDYIMKPIEKIEFQSRVNMLSAFKLSFENTLNYQKEKEKRYFLEIISELNKNLNNTLDYKEIKIEAVRVIDKIIKYDKMYFFVEDVNKFQYISDNDVNEFAKDTLKILNLNKEKINNIKFEEKIYNNEGIEDIKLKKGLIIPTFYNQNINGIIILEGIEENIENTMIVLLYRLLAQIGFVIENVKMIKNIMENKSLSTMVSLSKAIVHELRTPLSGISGFNNLAKSKIKKLKEKSNENDIKEYEKIENYMETIDKDVKRVDFMAKELLEYAGIKEYKLDFQMINLKNIFENIKKDNISIIETENIIFNIEIDEKVEIEADYNKFYTAIYNIIKNSIEAMDYNKEKNIIKISYIKNQIIIEDNGIGIEEEKKDILFKPLVSTKTQGTGLGLAITEGIIKKHGFSIEIESIYGEGTKIRIKI